MSVAEARAGDRPLRSDLRLITEESAPSIGADSLKSTETRLHEKPVVFRNGLVDPRAVYAYANQCHCEDLVTPRQAGNHYEEGHHLYFPLPKFKNNWAPWAVRRLRNVRTNHIMMLNCQEDFYHQETADEVPHEEIDIEAAETLIEEEASLVDYVASSFLAAELKQHFDELPLFKLERTRVAARLALVEEMLEEDEAKVADIMVMDGAIVLGALSRYHDQQPEHNLEATIKRLEARRSVNSF